VLLRLEIPSGICAELCTVAASNNGDHALQSFLLLVARATHIYFCSSNIPFVVNHRINATPLERLQQCFVFSCTVTRIQLNFHSNLLCTCASGLKQISS